MSYQVQPLSLDSHPSYPHFHCLVLILLPLSSASTFGSNRTSCHHPPSTFSYQLLPESSSQGSLSTLPLSFLKPALSTHCLHSRVQIFQHGSHHQGSALFRLYVPCPTSGVFQSFQLLSPKGSFNVFFFFLNLPSHDILML